MSHLFKGTAIGTHLVKWGCFSSINLRSLWQFMTILKSALNLLIVSAGEVISFGLSKLTNA